MNFKQGLIIITGPTATGKTQFASHLAYKINAEIISADSRQVYKKMDIGTGKDFVDYEVRGFNIPYYLIDIKEPGTKYNVYEFQKDFLKSYHSIREKNKNVILCGGTGMYIESVLKGYKLIQVPINSEKRKVWESQTREELIEQLSKLKQMHNISDITNRKRLIRALEINSYYSEQGKIDNNFPTFNSIVFGINFDRPQIRKRITQRLEERLKNGMIEEVEDLLKTGISAENLIYYGLEYKFVTLYLTGQLTYNEMFNKLNTAIHQFAKRQMTWFRRMERQDIKIHWLDGYASIEEKIDRALSLMKKNQNK
ncbi:MAG: tRNA (adenosine(37)-N6)-dimethylallyltransferase MiaA [Chlorobi bacterium]|nr:tRNA (adenosine(37)-N6)-dimethylallyltransferase MiaA [Chlorobiota bacterium]